MQKLLAQAQFQPKAVQYMNPAPAGTRKNWPAYKARFTDPLRIKKGKAFLREHAKIFTRAEIQYGVPREIIAAIIGVETLYGTYTGNFRVIDVLVTLAFDYPRRAAFFQSELAAFLQLAHAGYIAPLALKGSYAGAVGLPQFMPGSVLRWGVDGDGDGIIDLHGSPADVIMSVGRFLQGHGWLDATAQSVNGFDGVAYETVFADESITFKLANDDALPRYTLDELRISGITLKNELHTRQIGGRKLAVIELQHADGTYSFLLGTENFQAITKYNHSFMYAAAVWQLSLRLA